VEQYLAVNRRSTDIAAVGWRGIETGAGKVDDSAPIEVGDLGGPVGTALVNNCD
jgi:hypothetical protein